MNCDIFNLKFLAANAYARYLWEKPTIKTKLKEACESNIRCSYSRRLQKTLAGVTKELVIEVINNDSLPASVQGYIVRIVESQGVKIFHWIRSLEVKFEFESDCVSTIYFTTSGKIDQIKIFNEWISDDLVVAQNFLPLCKMACCLAQMEFLNNHSAEIKNCLDKFNHYTPVSELSINTFSYVNPSIRRLESKYYSRTLLDIRERKNAEAYMFGLAVEAGCVVVAKYWWGKLNEIDQHNNIMLIADKYISMAWIAPCPLPLLHSRYKRTFIWENHVEILFFLMNKMPQDKRKKLLKNNGRYVLSMLLSVWPEQELFVLFWEKIKNYLSVLDCNRLLKDILMLWEKDNDLELSTNQDFYFNIFQAVWCSLPENFKHEIMRENENHYLFNNNKIMYQLFFLFHIKTLKLVINDEDLKNKKEYLIGKGITKFQRLVECGKYKLLDKFVEEIFNSDGEKEKFKLGLHFYDSVIGYEQIDEAKQFFIWQVGRNGNKQASFDCKGTCAQLIKENRYDTAENLIEWVFETEEEREAFRNNFKSDEFVKERIYAIWSDEKEYNKELITNEFLKWLFKSESIVNEIKNQKLIVNDECVMVFCQHLKGSRVSNKIKILKKYLTFCEVHSGKVGQIKRNLMNKISHMVLNDNKLEVNFSIVELAMKWCFPNDNLRNKQISTLMQSVDIISFCNRIVTADEYESARFFNVWIKKSKNIEKLKNELKLRKEVLNGEIYSKALLYCLQKIEKRRKVLYDDAFHQNEEIDSDDSDYYHNDSSSCDIDWEIAFMLD